MFDKAPSPEELRTMREFARLMRAAADASDRAMTAFEQGNTALGHEHANTALRTLQQITTIGENDHG